MASDEAADVPRGGHAASGETDHAEAAATVARMTLAEKASLCSGHDFWTTTPVERLGVPSVTLTDGPHGVRMQRGSSDHLGLGVSEPATCFPTGSALAATWDRDLVAEVGAAIAVECLALGVDVLLGPGVNIKRDPRCGRNFEYLSEDPLLAGELAASFIRGVQSSGVGTSVKHLAGNDQETRRMSVDAVYDDRTLRELELTAFEIAVRRGRPWTVMGAYNRLNGTYACEHPWLLGDLLRDEWGHDGIVVTDWGAASDRVAGLAAGCDLEMPGSDGSSDEALVAAVEAGRLDEAVLDVAATRLVTLARRAEAGRRPATVADHEAHHALARRVAAAATVLCRNVDGALPLAPDDRVAVVGRFATEPRYQGTGSSRIAPTRLDTLLGELTELVGGAQVTYAAGYGDGPDPDEPRITEAISAAADADVVVVCVGLPDGHENEGDDRADLALPAGHDALVAALAAVHDRVVVVLSNGAPVELPWAEDVAAVVEGYLGGQAGAGGVADVLTGRRDPGGRLGETFPRHLTDLPTARSFPGGPTTVEHRESVYVGYRFHDTVGGPVRYPFGHGLSYTTFAQGEVSLAPTSRTPDELAAGAGFTVRVPLTNVGDRAGSHVVQVYVREVAPVVHRPDRELRAFAKVHLEAGEATTVELELGARDLAFWDVTRDAWTVAPGRFEVLVGASSRDLAGPVGVTVTGEALPVREEPAVYRQVPNHLVVDAASYAALRGAPTPVATPAGRPFTRDTPIADTTGTRVGRLLAWAAVRQARAAFPDDGGGGEAALARSVTEMPVRTMRMAGASVAQVDAVVDLLNGRPLRALRRGVTDLRRRRAARS